MSLPAMRSPGHQPWIPGATLLAVWRHWLDIVAPQHPCFTAVTTPVEVHLMAQPALPPPTILVVEENADARAAAVDAITAAGFNVTDASSGDDALRILQAQHDIGLVFTSINMTGNIDGVGLAVRIHRDWPTLAIVMTSAVVELRQSSLPQRCRFLKKPYRLEDAIRCFRLLL